MDLKLSGKLALITGSTKGIGFATAKSLAKEGAKVIINGRSEQSVTAAIEKITQENPTAELKGFAGDMANATYAERLKKEFPKLDILVNNMAIFEPKTFTEIDDEQWRHFFEVNVLSGVRLSRLYIDQMMAENWGRIIFISSESAVQIPVEMIHYGMTKTAQLAISRGLAEYAAGTGVTVNSILPGPTHSDGVDDFVKKISGGASFEAFEEEFFKSVRPSSLIKRFASTEEVANMVTYVCSPLASATTGAALRVDGGVVRACV
ncbi:SDR family NAD(P)-dependent oxidoreductase [Sessilibacter sp. MAH4]